MRAPAFSLVITNHNKARFLSRAIRSCLNQVLLRQFVEVILIDDASTDESSAIYGEFEKDVRIIRFSENRGVAAASNAGLEAATGRYWMRVDADDFLSAQACAFMGAILDSDEGLTFVYGDHIRVDRIGRSVEHVRLDTVERLRQHGAGVLFRREALLEVGGYDSELRNAEDYDLLVRMELQGMRGFHLPVPLYRYYLEPDDVNLSQASDRQATIDEIRSRHGV